MPTKMLGKSYVGTKYKLQFMQQHLAISQFSRRVSYTCVSEGILSQLRIKH